MRKNLRIYLIFITLTFYYNISLSALELDHFLSYQIIARSKPIFIKIHDQFMENDVFKLFFLNKPVQLMNPVQKTHDDTVTAINNPDTHLISYRIMGPKMKAAKLLNVSNQFGDNQEWIITKRPRWFINPVEKKILADSLTINNNDQLEQNPNDNFNDNDNVLNNRADHYMCYLAHRSNEIEQLYIGTEITLKDQFHEDKQYILIRPSRFCNPVTLKYGYKQIRLDNKGRDNRDNELKRDRRLPDDRLAKGQDNIEGNSPDNKGPKRNIIQKLDETNITTIEPQDPDKHLACYIVRPIDPKKTSRKLVELSDIFGTRKAITLMEREICVPSKKVVKDNAFDDGLKSDDDRRSNDIEETEHQEHEGEDF
jgi:hypothetical protein